MSQNLDSLYRYYLGINEFRSALTVLDQIPNEQPANCIALELARLEAWINLDSLISPVQIDSILELRCPLGRPKSDYLQYVKGLAAFQSSKVFPSSPPQKGYYRAKYLVLLSRKDYDQGPFEPGIERLEEARLILGDMNPSQHFGLFEVSLWKGKLLSRLNRPSESNQEYTIALSHLRKVLVAKPRELDQLYNNMANNYLSLWDYKNARDYYQKSKELLSQYPATYRDKVITLNNLAVFYHQFGNRYQANLQFDQALGLVNSVDDEVVVAEVKKNYANLLVDIKRSDEAIPIYQEAAAMATQNRAEAYFWIQFNLGHALLEQKRYGDLARLVISLNEFVTDTFPEAHYIHGKMLVLEGTYLSGIEDYDSAVQSFKQARLIISSHLGDEHIEVSEIDGSIASALSKSQPKESLKLYRSAYLSVKKSFSQSHPLRCQYLNDIGMMHSELGQADSAIFYFAKSLEENNLPSAKPYDFDSMINQIEPFEAIVSVFQIASTRHNKYLKSNNREDLVLAKVYINLALKFIEVQQNAVFLEQDKLSFYSQTNQVYQEAFQINLELFRNGDPSVNFEHLFGLSEQVKYKVFLEILDQKRIQKFARISNDILEKEINLTRDKELLARQIASELAFEGDINMDLLDEFKVTYQKIDQGYRQLLDSIQTNFTAYYDLKYNRQLVTVEQVRDHILKDDGEALVEFITGNTKIYGLIITQSGEYVLELGDTEVIESNIGALRKLMSIKDQTRLPEISDLLYQLLIHPMDSIFLLNKLSIDRLYLTVDGKLSNLPFEVLTRGTSNYLIEDYEISYSYSSTLLHQQISQSSYPIIDNTRFVGFAPSFPSGEQHSVERSSDRHNEEAYLAYEFSPLIHAREEINQIGLLLDKNDFNYHLFDSDRADEATFKSLDLSNYDYIHLATHGFVNIEHPMLSGLGLTRNDDSDEDDVLYSSEVFGLDLDANLVTLSACETGLGALYDGEGVIGLTRSFFYAGARNLLVSFWNVDDQATSILMVNFYRNVFGRNQSLSSALRKAKLKQLKSKEHRHPYYWSAFALIGS